MTRTPTRWTLGFVLLVSIWGLNYLFVRWGLDYSGPLWLAGLRAGVGAVGMAAFLAVRRPSPSLTWAQRREALLLGVPNTALFFGLWFLAEVQVPPGETAVLVYTFPLWVALFSITFLAEAIRPRVAVAIAVGFVGVVALTQPWGFGTLPLAPAALGELLLAAMAWAAGTLRFKRRFPAGTALEANFFQLVGGSGALLLGAAVLEPGGEGAGPSLAAATLWLGLVGTALGYSIWFTLLERLPATRLSAFVFLVPVVALAASIALLGERVDAVQALGIAIVLLGVYLAAGTSGPGPEQPLRPSVGEAAG